jgi:hypothetical protein
VSVNEAGPVIVTSLQAEFDLLPSGYVQALLLKDGRELSLDEPGAAASFFGDILSSAGREIRDFSLDLAHPKVSDVAGRLGPVGKRMEITRHPESRTVRLTPEKEAYWKKWIDIYNPRMLSRGEFRNLYVCGYDVPEGYAIEKDGRMYYVFFSPDPGKPLSRRSRTARPAARAIPHYGLRER